MRRLAVLGVASVTTLALATPALAVAATAASDGSSNRSTHAAQAASTVAEKAASKKRATIKLKRAEKGVQPGIGKQKITAIVNGGGKVKFTLKGTGLKASKKIKVKKGKAVYDVPPLGTGTYKVVGKYAGKKAKTKFEVYDSALTINQTSFTVSKSGPLTNAQLTGSVKFKGKVATGGYVDIYKDGNIKGGSSSPDFLSFATVQSNGTFSYPVADRVALRYPVGTYTFQAYYTDDPAFADYISSNFITVTVTP